MKKNVIMVIVALVGLSDGIARADEYFRVERLGYLNVSYCNEIEVVGDIAYTLTSNDGLRTIDIAEPERTEILDTFDVNERFGSLSVYGDFAYVICDHVDLYIFDVSDPRNIRQIATYDIEPPISEVYIYNHYAFLNINRNRFSILDVSDPEDLVEVFRSDSLGNIRHIEIVDDFAYVAIGNPGLLIFNVENPEETELIGSCGEDWSIGDVFICENFAYLSDYSHFLRIVDVSNPEDPSLVSSYETQDQCRQVEVHDNHAYVGVSDHGLRILNITDPEDIFEVAYYESGRDIRDIYVDDRFIICVDRYCRIYSFDPNTHTIYLTENQLDFGNVRPNQHEEMAVTLFNRSREEQVVENFFTFTDFYDCGFEGEIIFQPMEERDLVVTFNPDAGGIYDDRLIIECAEPDGEIIVELDGCCSVINEVSSIDVQDYNYDLKMKDEFVFVAGTEGICVVDISDPEQPNHVETVVVGVHGMGWNMGSYELALNDWYAFTPIAYIDCLGELYSGGLNIVAIDDPPNAQLVEYIDICEDLRGVAANDRYAFANSENSKLIFDTRRGRVVGEIGLLGSTAADEENVFISNRGVNVIDISNPEEPEVIAWLEMESSSKLIRDGDYLYINSDGLRIVDISNPEEPEEIGSCPLPRRIYDMVVQDDFLIIADWNHIVTVDISDRENPEVIDIYGISATQVGVYNQHIFCTSNYIDLVVLDISDIINRENNDDGDRELTIRMDQDWNMISINITPDEELWANDQGPDVELMMEQLRINEDNHHIMLVKDEDGLFYLPAFDFNNIPHWDLTQGYLVKVDEEVEVVWTGEQISADTDIAIEEGWNYIAYFPTYELDASVPDYYALEPIIDHVEIAKDGDGNFMLPAFDFSNMPPWRETQGYQVRVDEDVVLNYPEEQEEVRGVGCPNLTANTPPYPPLLRRGGVSISTDQNMSLLITSFNGIEIACGDQVGAFDAGGVLVGNGIVNEDGRCGLAVWGDDTSTDGIDGLQTGEGFTLKLWNGEIETELAVQEIQAGDGLVYLTDTFVVLDVEVSSGVPLDYELSGAFPNPFNATINISYSVPNSSKVSIQVFDLSGRSVKTLVNEIHKAGKHSFIWRSGNAVSGVYLIRMESATFCEVQKVVLLR